MLKYNILLIIIDCLRSDRVTPNYMPRLHAIGEENVKFDNYWATSHCTDPSITSLLTGKWPDELKLYSMMFGTDWTLPDNVKMLGEIAQENGYVTGMISNLVRWYKRGMHYYVDNRGWHGMETFNRAVHMIRKELKEPWFLTIHDDSCHSNYRGGSYDRACQEVDLDIGRIVEFTQKSDTLIFITSDHGEGLGERGIDMHGFGLWPFLTRVPLIIKFPDSFGLDTSERTVDVSHIAQPMGLNTLMNVVMTGRGDPVFFKKKVKFAHMVGRTPRFWHRAVTDGDRMVIKQQDVKTNTRTYTYYDVGQDKIISRNTQPAFLMWDKARDHAAQFGLNADDDKLDDTILEERLKSLGYFE